jgi:DNA invertase Pin-like site-specific DNA recombinase
LPYSASATDAIFAQYRLFVCNPVHTISRIFFAPQHSCGGAVNLVHDLTGRGVGLKVLAGQGAHLDTTTANDRLVFGIFAALAEFERELIIERTRAGLISARARGRNGGRPFKMTAAKLRLAQAAMGQPGTKVGALCAELGITRQTL